jgi:UDP-N-acetylglucosamine:LPS N-acetylglucosamine transferase
MKPSKVDIVVVSSCGGHLSEAQTLIPVYSRYRYCYVLNDRIKPSGDIVGRLFYISHSERDLLFFANILESFLLLSRMKPRVVISTGAGPAVPFSLVAKLAFGSSIIFIESLTRVNKPSLTGRLMYYIADHFFYQWPQLASFFPGGKYITLI